MSDDELGEIIKEIKQKSRIRQPFAYFINNCVSVMWCPNWFWSAMCDLIRWWADRWLTYDMDVVWKLINDTFYKHITSEDYLVTTMIEDIVRVICEEWMQLDYLERLERRYMMW